MFSLKKQKGFTIVELLIVIVVIGILATLVIVTFSGIQQKGRNSQRQTDINALQGHVEAFYADKGFYPTIQQIQTPAWVTANMKGLDPESLKDPKAGTSITGATSTTTSFAYGYVAFHDDGSTACASASGTDDDTLCTKFTLTAAQEGTTTVYTKSSN